jgi:hypothetical protein
MAGSPAIRQTYLINTNPAYAGSRDQRNLITDGTDKTGNFNQKVSLSAFPDIKTLTARLALCAAA